MQIKKRNILRAIFAIVIFLNVIIISFEYTAFERRILLFEMIRGMIILYLVIIEFTLSIFKNFKILNKYWKKTIIMIICIFALFTTIVCSTSVYQLSVDTYLGYQSKVVTILERNWQYSTSDKVEVIVGGRIQTYSLAPGYVEVNVGSTYSAHIFEKSRIILLVKKSD
ncbi:hypothetical protein H1230_10735 [Paenibacillus sp. 19GGS1-52]|uniref:hypothetical protein n=1 Tax=Paenibacillus sp. 19GGS1-52 TaxID=2758563 RepID=UPI001EFA9BEC|nr:hypothetical protein [Paenibacillus sp. 19GGS1-52]ULO09198.1 hypothetical protein H1230_10735 [Paenibacillus sp. 19GGS1-52]